MNKNNKAPQIFQYRDLSEYLKDVYKYRKARENGFSYEKWAEQLGLKSRSYLRSLVLGEKKAALNLLPLFLTSLELNDDEASYFVNLYNLQAAPSPEIRALYTKEVFKTWRRQIQEADITDIEEFLSDPLIPQLFTYLSFDDSPTEIAQWAQDLLCEVSAIEKALRCLVWQKLVEGQVLDNGKVVYRTSSPFFRVPHSPANSHLREFHLQGIRQAEKAATESSEKRKLYSTFVALSPEQFERAQELIRDFNQQILAIFNEKTVSGKKLYRLNQQLLSVSGTVATSGQKIVEETL